MIVEHHCIDTFVGLARGQNFLCILHHNRRPRQRPKIFMPISQGKFPWETASYDAESRILPRHASKKRGFFFSEGILCCWIETFFSARCWIETSFSTLCCWIETFFGPRPDSYLVKHQKRALFAEFWGKNSAFSPKFSMLNFLNSDFGFCTS